jgi:hypothetical protein
MSDRGMKRGMVIAIAGIGTFYAVGFALFFDNLAKARLSIRAADWPTTPVRISQLEIKENWGDDSTTYRVEVEYRYVVNRVSYTGSRLAFGYTGDSNRAPHDEILHKLKEAKVVAARYDPSDPSESCLSYGLHRSVLFKLVFAATWLTIGIGVAVGYWLTSRGDGVLLKNLSVE